MILATHPHPLQTGRLLVSPNPPQLSQVPPEIGRRLSRIWSTNSTRLLMKYRHSLKKLGLQGPHLQVRIEQIPCRVADRKSKIEAIVLVQDLYLRVTPILRKVRDSSSGEAGHTTIRLPAPGPKKPRKTHVPTLTLPIQQLHSQR